MQEHRKSRDLPKQLKEFGLPVLQRVAAYLDQKFRHLHGLLMRKLLLHISKPGKYPMS